MDTHSVTDPKGRHFLAFAILLAIAALAWMFYGADAWVIPYLRGNWLYWFGVEWFKDTEWRTLPILISTALGPMILFGFMSFLFFSKYYYLNFATIHQTNLLELEKAKSALQQGLASVSAIEREYKGKFESYQQLQKQLEELQSVKEIDTEDLRRKLSAIAIASQNNVWVERGIGFFIGVCSSLFATYAWEKLHSI